MSDAKLPIRILLSNDDGINAPGLVSLEKIARSLSDDVWVVAPETEESGASRKLTLTMPLRIREVGPQRFAVQGTPTDCVLLGVNHVLKGKPPALIEQSGLAGEGASGEMSAHAGVASASGVEPDDGGERGQRGKRHNHPG